MLKRKIGTIVFGILFILGVVFVTRAQTDTTSYIDSIDPIQGPVGTEIAISGNSFGSEEGEVFFYKTKKATIYSWKDEQIICRVPAGTLTGNVLVMTEEGEKSNALKFKIIAGVLIAPSSIKEENITTKSVTLEWGKSTGAISYRVSLGTDSKATNLKTVDIKEPSYDKSNLAQNKTYYWKVKSISSSSKKDSGWSRIASFKTKAEEVKPVAPAQPQKKGLDTTSLIVIAVIIFIILFGIFMLIGFFLRRRKQGLGETDLNAEPEETSIDNNQQEDMPRVENKSGIDNISGPPDNTSGGNYQIPQEPQPPLENTEPDDLTPSSPDQSPKF